MKNQTKKKKKKGRKSKDQLTCERRDRMLYMCLHCIKEERETSSTVHQLKLQM